MYYEDLIHLFHPPVKCCIEIKVLDDMDAPGVPNLPSYYRRLRPIADQFSAQRVGGAYLGITLEKIPFVVALTTYMEPIAICILIKHFL